MGRQGIVDAYNTGRGRVVLRAKTEIEELAGGREAIVVTEIPYMVNKSEMQSRIGEMVRDKKIEGISDIRDSLQPQRNTHRVPAQEGRQRQRGAQHPLQVHGPAEQFLNQ